MLALLGSAEEMAVRYLKELRRVRPEGPYRLSIGEGSLHDPPHVAAVAAVLAGYLAEASAAAPRVPASSSRNTRVSGSVAVAQMRRTSG